MKTSFVCLVVLVVAAVPSARAQKVIALDNVGFEQQLTAWDSRSDNGMSVVSAEAARSGKAGLRVTDASDTLGSSVASKRVPVAAGKTYEARFAGRVVSGDGIAVYLRFFDAKGKPLTSQQLKNEVLVALKRSETQWKQFTVRGVAPEGATRVDVWIHSFSKSKVTADFDDFTLVEIET